MIDEKGCKCMQILEDECYRDEAISFLRYGDYQKRQRKNFNHAIKGTGEWFLNSPEFSTWVSGRGQTLYCPGILGAGKTTMMAIAVDNVRRRFQHDPSVGVAFLYLDEDTTCDDGRCSFPCALLRQFVEYGSPRGDSPALRALYARHRVFETRPDCEELLEVLRTVMGNYTKTYIFVDSIHRLTPETCPGGRDDLIDLLMALQANLGTNLLYTSRPIPAVENHLARAVSLEIRATEEDLRLYLETDMAKLSGFIRNDPERRKEVIDGITSKADGM